MDKCREGFEQYIRSQSGFTADFQIGCNAQYKSDLMHFMFVTWQHQQAKVEELQKRVDSLTQTTEELLEEMKYPTATFEEVIVCGVKLLEQALKGEG